MVSKNNIYILFGIILLITLLIFTLLQTKPPFWDEAYYLENIINLNKFGFSKKFLIEYKGPAGPTYTLIHYLFQPITKLSVPLVRIVNIVFLLGILFNIKKTFDILNKTKSNSLIFTVSSLAIGTVYTISGFALTEVFGVFFMTFTIFQLVKYYKKNKNNYLLALLSGLSFSLAILGRQPLIVMWLALPLLFLKQGYLFKIDFERNEFLKFVIITVVSSLILPLYIFSIWGNFQPLSTQFTGIGISPINLILSFGYAAIFTFFIKPNYFKFLNKKINYYEFITVIAISFFLNFYILKIEFIPFNGIISNWFNDSLISYYKIFCGSFLAIVGLSFIYFFTKKNLLQKEPLTLFFAFGFLLIISTSFKVTHQFSPRYVVQAFPLIVLAVHSNEEQISWLSLITLTVGGVLGIVSLNSYY